MADIGIIGWGVVGQAAGNGFATKKGNRIYWFDEYKKSPYTLGQVVEKSEFIFVCVPTPVYDDESGIDLSVVNSVVKNIAEYAKGTNKIVIIKSTVIPGTTAGFSRKYKDVEFAMNPEFLTEINAPWDFLNPSRVVIGSLNEDSANKVAILHRDLYGYDIPIFITDPTTAELAKYMANTFMATKVIFANEMAELAEKLGVNYNSVKEMVTADPRITKSFFGVSPFGGFGGKCFPKDTMALLSLAKKLKVDLSVLDAAWKKNLKIRKFRDWEVIKGAVSKIK
ncbi:UDP-glucose/GDP-mannose dehydrogenase family protein [Candidatus Woesebacteria bacterium]|nr:MAG: UDP-glucose/GDP-mannose dehydrogenase family protein [Candidatus Woesebacteria bacterium]